MLSGAWAYLRAFLPLILVVVLATVAIVAWTTWGPKTETPNDAWTRMETKWETQRTAALKEITSAGTNADAQVTGYQHLRDATRGWITDLGTVKDWTDAKQSAVGAGQATAAVQNMITQGKTEADYIDGLTAANLSERLTLLYNYETAFTIARDQARSMVMGTAASPQPTLATPPPDVSPSASAGVSASPAPSVTAAPTASPAPSASS